MLLRSMLGVVLAVAAVLFYRAALRLHRAAARIAR
jgi:hypothetical protein